MVKLLQVKDISIGRNIRKIRKNHKLSQNDVIIQLELRGRSLSRSHYANIESGSRNIYVSDLILLKDIFQVPYEEFFAFSEAEKIIHKKIDE